MDSIARPAQWQAGRLLLLAALGPAVVLGAALAIAQPASAHELRQVGPYEFFVGFMVEPAYVAFPNGVDLTVTLDGEPVEGLEATLQVEVAHESGVARRMPLRPVADFPGRYTADLIPTAPGRYAFRFVGLVGDLRVDELFVGGEGRFVDVQPAETIRFPEVLGQESDTGTAIGAAEQSARQAATTANAARNAARAAQDTASSARTLGIIGVALGAIGVLLGAGALAVAILLRPGEPRPAGAPPPEAPPPIE